MSRSFFVVCLVALFSAAVAFSETPVAPTIPNTFTLGSVVQLQRAGMTDEDITLIMRRMPSSRLAFDTSAQGLATMKEVGFSNQLIAAILVRSGNDNAPAPTNGWRAAEPARQGEPTATQGGKSVTLRPGGVATTFAQAKKGAGPMATLKTLGIGAGINLGTIAAASGIAGSAVGMAAPIAMPAILVWDSFRTKTVKGYSYELLPQTSSTNVILADGTHAETRITVPLASFDDGRYAHATPVLLSLDISSETQTRVAGTAKAEVKESPTKGPGEPKVVEQYQRNVLGAETAKIDDGTVTVRYRFLARGEYAVAFIFDGKALPAVIDFSVR